MNILKKLFNISNDDGCAIGLCKFQSEIEDLTYEQSKTRAKMRLKKDISVTQMLRRPV